MNFFKNKTNLQKISVCLGIIKGCISLALLTNLGNPDFKQYDQKVQDNNRFGRKF
jgi:hypothetical protein